MTDITPDELKQRMAANEKMIVIDVREPYEYDERNLGATNIPLATLPDKLDELEQYKNEEIIVHCKGGSRSANAKAFLLSKGFTNVRNLLGGIMAM